nr:PREDICTED: uncharacterized SDCCAG3 family protein-like [Linepithema humile]XP_012217769.1 PREDICTED: uncharacterized SDCCAG3 family protein-like [Linepithema humile]
MDDKELFYVIEFYDGIQIIPDNWIIENETLAYWPKVKTNKDFDTLVRTRSSIKDNWTLEPIKAILYKTDSFLNAKVKLKKAEYQSDVDSPYNTDEKKKQRRDHAKVQFTSDNESDEEQIRERKTNVKLKKKLPPLPPVPIAMSSKATSISNNICSNISDVTKINVLNNSCSVVSAATHSKSHVSNNSSPFVDINKTLSSNSRSQKLDISVLSSNNDKEMNQEIHQILKIVQNLKISMNGLTSLNREIIERLDVLEKNSESLQVQSVLDEHNTLVEVFPIKTANSLKEVETKIENNSAFKGKLVKSLTQVTSADIKKTIRNILHYLITDEMAQDYSWLGQRCKTAFQNLEISKILTLVKIRHEDATYEQISSVVAEWLKHAKQRVQRKSQKEEKCRQKEPQITSGSDNSENNESI